MSDLVDIDYTNYKGERSRRRIEPIALVFRSTDYHPKEQWLLRAWCMERQAMRTFAMADIHSWTPVEEGPVNNRPPNPPFLDPAIYGRPVA